MTITVAGKNYELTGCRFLDWRHCDISGRQHCPYNGYVRGVKTAKHPHGCRCKHFAPAFPEKELAIRKIDCAYKYTSIASQHVATYDLAKARMETRNALICLDGALELIEKLETDLSNSKRSAV